MVTQYPGIRPAFSVKGTKTSGKTAAPIFQLHVAQYRFGKGSFCTLKREAMKLLPAPYEPASKPVRMEMKQKVTVRIHLYTGDQLNLLQINYEYSKEFEMIFRVVRPIPCVEFDFFAIFQAGLGIWAASWGGRHMLCGSRK
jgi:hypothetical protein